MAWPQARPGSPCLRPWPGLRIRYCRLCAAQPGYACQGLRVDIQDQRTVLLASVPLDDTGREPLPEGTALALESGDELLRAPYDVGTLVAPGVRPIRFSLQELILGGCSPSAHWIVKSSCLDFCAKLSKFK